MRYNIILCNLNIGKEEDAQTLVNQIKVDLDQPFYGDYINFKKWIGGEV